MPTFNVAQKSVVCHSVKYLLFVAFLVLPLVLGEAAERFRVEVVYFRQAIVFPNEGFVTDKPITNGVFSPEHDSPITDRLVDPKVAKDVFPPLEVEAGIAGTTPDDLDRRLVLTATVTPEKGDVVHLALEASDSNVLLGKPTTDRTKPVDEAFPISNFKSAFSFKKGYWAAMTPVAGGDPGTYAFRVTSVMP